MFTASPVITFRNRSYAIDLPNLAFATAIAAWSIWFCHDAWQAGPEIENMILILPLTLAAVAIYLFVAAGCVRPVAAAAPPRARLTRNIQIRIAGTMVLLSFFVVAGPMIGFDIAVLVYMLGMMLLLGERRVLVILLMCLLFCALLIYCFNNLLLTPLPLFFFQGDN